VSGWGKFVLGLDMFVMAMLILYWEWRDSKKQWHVDPNRRGPGRPYR